MNNFKSRKYLHFFAFCLQEIIKMIKVKYFDSRNMERMLIYVFINLELTFHTNDQIPHKNIAKPMIQLKICPGLVIDLDN